MQMITIGITGHRDIVVSEEIRKKILVFFEKQLQKYSSLRLFSPLAEGADRLVAECFLEKKKTYPKLKLYVPMPFETERYLEDFDEASKEVFLRLAEQAEQIYSVGKSEQSGYLDVGRYVVDESQILLALWDGTFNGKIGGTGDIVHYARGLGREVLHIVCEREQSI